MLEQAGTTIQINGIKPQKRPWLRGGGRESGGEGEKSVKSGSINTSPLQ